MATLATVKAVSAMHWPSSLKPSPAGILSRSIVVRPHPSDNEADLERIRQLLDEAGVPGTMTNGTADLAEQAAAASLVVTATSSGIFCRDRSGNASVPHLGAGTSQGLREAFSRSRMGRARGQ